MESGINSLSGGQQLSNTELSFFGPRLGADFSGVRVHNTDQAHSLADSINARAFTRGSDIVFAKGEYAPGTGEGKKLLAHELVHVVQGGKGVIKKKPYVKGQSFGTEARNLSGKLNLYKNMGADAVISEEDYGYFYKSKPDANFNKIADNMECIAYATEERKIGTAFSSFHYYVLGGTGKHIEEQWRTLLNDKGNTYIYHYVIRPFMMAAIGRLPKGFTFLRNGPAEPEVITFMRALFGVDKNGKSSVTIPDPDVLQGTKTNIGLFNIADDVMELFINQYLAQYINYVSSGSLLTSRFIDINAIENLNSQISRNAQSRLIINSTAIALSCITTSMLSQKAYIDGKISDVEFLRMDDIITHELENAGYIIRYTAAIMKIQTKETKDMIDAVVNIAVNLIPIKTVGFITSEIFSFLKNNLKNIVSGFINGFLILSNSESLDPKRIVQKFNIATDDFERIIFINEKQKTKYKSSNIKKSLKNSFGKTVQ